MACLRVPGGVLTIGGPTRKIRIDGAIFLFEEHSHLGPMPCRADGGERKLGPCHVFWHAVTEWYQRGKKIGADGFCIWQAPVIPITKGQK